MRRRFTVTAATATLALAGAMAAPHAPADIQHPAVVGTNPIDRTPHVLDGTVRAIAVVGGKVVVGGNFTKVREAGNSTQVARTNLFAFDFATGKIEPNFKPAVNGTVYALQTGDSNTVYVAGSFSTVNGDATGRLAKLTVPAGAVAGGFKPDVSNGMVSDIKRRGSQLYLGGTFWTVNGKSRAGLARVNAATGAVDGNFTLKPSEPRAGVLKVQSLALNPQGTRLVVNGTFTKINGARRVQIAMINTDASPATLSSWSTERYAATCNINSFHTYMRDMDFSPDGSYFVVVTTGGPFGNTTLCDTAARWETNRTGGGQQPTWVNWTGGDTLLAVSVTGPAVYVGGHQRWQDNPYGSDFAGPGAVSRPGIAALSPGNGKALSWNPTRSRGHGVEILLATPQGLFVGSDTDQLGKEFHGRIGFFPLP